MYVSGNPASKAELKRWLKAGKNPGVYAPGMGEVPHDGIVHLEGPHYPKAHSWYGKGTMEKGRLIKVT